MPKFTLRKTLQNFRPEDAEHLAQGQFTVSADPIYTVLKSCVCAGFYHPEKGIGAISHFTGLDQEGPSSTPALLSALISTLERLDAPVAECECFVLGGTERSPRVLRQVVHQLERRKIQYATLSTLGKMQRKIRFEPATGVLTLYEKEDQEEAPSYFAPGESLHCFNDPRARTATGATTLFRNPALLKNITNAVLPAISQEGNRFHVWCAGCSIGMEVYSIAMVTLDWMKKNRKSLPFKILGSDISEEALETARKGEYPVAKSLSPEFRRLINTYTDALDPTMVSMGKQLRSAALFRHRDLGHGSRKHKFDLVVCDHVFQYFTEERQLEYLKALISGCTPGGFLFLSTPLMRVSDAVMHQHPFHRLNRNFYQMQP